MIDPDAVIAGLREQGLSKFESIRAVRSILDLTAAEAKTLVHHSPVWADRRQIGEDVEEAFFRGLFIDCVLGNGQVNEPPEWVAECLERQGRARELIRATIAALPDGLAAEADGHLAAGRYGDAFTGLVEICERTDAATDRWRELAAAAEALCLNELLLGGGWGADAPDYVRAAIVVRDRSGRGGGLE